MNGPAVLITGQRGFLGRRLAGFLRSEFPGVRLLDPPDPIPFNNLPVLTSFLREHQPSTIFHLAAHQGDSSSMTRPLLDGLLQVESTARIVLPGSAAEYGRVPPELLPVGEDFFGQPLSSYGLAKQAQTRLADEYARRGLDIVTTRIFNIIGQDAPPHTVIGSLLSKMRSACAAADKTMHVGELDIERDFVDIDDVSRALTLLARFGTSGEVYNICSGHSVALGRVLDEMIATAGVSIQVIANSPLIPKNPIKDIRGSIEKIQAATGWSARYSWNEAVARLFG